MREGVDGNAADPETLGVELARRMVAAGAGEILKRAELLVAGHSSFDKGSGS